MHIQMNLIIWIIKPLKVLIIDTAIKWHEIAIYISSSIIVFDGFYIEFRQSFAKETFSYDKYSKS